MNVCIRIGTYIRRYIGLSTGQTECTVTRYLLLTLQIRNTHLQKYKLTFIYFKHKHTYYPHVHRTQMKVGALFRVTYFFTRYHHLTSRWSNHTGQPKVNGNALPPPNLYSQEHTFTKNETYIYIFQHKHTYYPHVHRTQMKVDALFHVTHFSRVTSSFDQSRGQTILVNQCAW